MYYITNLNNQVVAADKDFLKLLRVNTLQELSTQIAKEKIEILESGDNIEIVNGIERIDLKQKRDKISTLLGDLILVEVLQSDDKKNSIQAGTLSVNQKKTYSSIFDDLDLPIETKKPLQPTYSFLLDSEDEKEKQIDFEKEAERKAQEEAQKVAETQRKAQEEALRRAQEVAEAEARKKAQEEAQRLAQEEAQRRAQEEAQRLAQEEALRVAETQRKIQEEAQRRAQEEALRAAEVQRKIQEEAQRLAQEEAQRRAQEEALRAAEAQRKIQEEAQRLAQEEIQRRVQEEALRAAEAQRKIQEEAQRLAQEEIQRRVQEEAERLAEEERRRAEEIEKLAQDDDDFSNFLLDEGEFEKDKTDNVAEIDNDNSFLLDESDFIKMDDEFTKAPAQDLPTQIDDSFLLDDDFLKPKAETKELDAPQAVEIDESFLLDENENFLQKNEQIETKVEEKIQKALPTADDITIDLKTLSEELGISEDDYLEFLNEFADKALEVKNDIEEYGSQNQSKAISSLLHLTQMLHITDITTIIDQIHGSTGEDEKHLIATFYQVIEKFASVNKESEELVVSQPNEEIIEESFAREEPKEKIVEVAEEKDEKICDLDFSNIKPIHFDFQLEKAAEDLSLPVDLIEEFVGDFIVQANEEKQTFIDACRRGDMDTIQKTGHKLKGVASNLRIIPLASTLEEVQFCSDKTRFESLLKKYWGQFLAFEAFIRTVKQN